jgi:hypothetical protein
MLFLLFERRLKYLNAILNTVIRACSSACSGLLSKLEQAMEQGRITILKTASRYFKYLPKSKKGIPSLNNKEEKKFRKLFGHPNTLASRRKKYD